LLSRHVKWSWSRFAHACPRSMRHAARCDYGGPSMPRMILVIEDEPGIVDFLQRGLRAHGFEVLAALDGIAGTDVALTENVDFVVLDLKLPGRSGLDALAIVSSAKPGRR
jgi:CheY-like chemotaxis protein